MDDLFFDHPVAQPDDPVRHFTDDAVVRDERAGAPLRRRDLAQEREHPDAGAEIQVARRLVAQEQGRVLGERAGNGDALLLAARQPAGKMIGAFRQANLVEQFCGPRGDALGVPLDQFQGELDILGGREGRNEIEELKTNPTRSRR